MQTFTFRVRLGFKMRAALWQTEWVTDSLAPDDSPNIHVIIKLTDGGTVSRPKGDRETYSPGPDWLLTDTLPVIIGITENFALLEDASFPIIKNVYPTLYVSDERFFNKAPRAVGVPPKKEDDPNPKIEQPTGLINEE